MKKAILTLFLISATTCTALAQPPSERGGPQGNRRSTSAVLAAIDANGDHEITMDEMKNAFAALNKLDANKDGKLGREEIHPEMAGGPGGPRGPRAGGPSGPDGSRESIVERIRGFDSNKDGKLSKEEIPARMKPVVARFDKNKDEVLDKDELAAMTERLAASVPDRGGPRDRSGFGGPPGRGGPGGPGGGPPGPERLMEDAFEFDANKDGLLSKAELQKFADEHARRGPPAGQFGGPGGRRGSPDGRQAGGDRPSRPARPE